MPLDHLTIAVISVTAVLLIAYDVWVEVKKPDGSATISWIMRQGAKAVPLIAVAWGVLTGHFFFPNCP